MRTAIISDGEIHAIGKATGAVPIAANDDPPQRAAGPADRPGHAAGAGPSPAPQAGPAASPAAGLPSYAYFATSALLLLTQGFGMNMIAGNLPQLQGAFSATQNEAAWLIAAYLAPNVSLSMALVKVRNQYGLRRFAECGILVFTLVCILHLFVTDLDAAIAVRFFAGVAAAPLSSLGFLYMIEKLPPERKLRHGIPAALTLIALMPSLTRIMFPTLFEIGGVHGLYLFELGLAMASLCAIYLLPLTSPPLIRAIERLDFVSYPLMAVGLGAMAIVLSTGRLYWWFEAPWLGELLVLSIVCLTLAIVIDLNRARPFIDVRWLLSPAMLHFTAVLLLFRLLLTEQTASATNFFLVLGLQSDQLTGLYTVIAIAAVIGGTVCALVNRPGREPYIHLVCLMLIAAGAWMDSYATNLTRPHDIYISQALMALASAMFLPPAMAQGIAEAFKRGPNHFLTFILVFLATQNIGGQLGSAVFGTMITLREKFHSNVLAQSITLTDPLVSNRVSQMSSTYGHTLTDRALLNAEGTSLLAQRITREANVLAYNDVFLAIAALSLLAAIGLVLHLAFNAIRFRMRDAVAA
ncbi:MFS transporter [Mycoplana sp. MJR14]|uniref:MFS transporter n=1 Tax=Mycoplana sp. MJR14 TaxID=3032583 RepID=UPI0023DC9530|nr:MFS transporter [Mycoplana sp. MJR14]MDF1631820.1 MFS transporter [Mycoplana sp. MJR14]